MYVHNRAANPANATPNTHNGWDGDCLVYVETEQRKTHTVHEPGSFVPLLRMPQATPDKAGTAQQAKSDAMAMLGITAEGVESVDGKVANDANGTTDTEGSADWQAMNEGLSSAAKSPLPELTK